MYAPVRAGFARIRPTLGSRLAESLPCRYAACSAPSSRVSPALHRPSFASGLSESSGPQSSRTGWRSCYPRPMPRPVPLLPILYLLHHDPCVSHLIVLHVRLQLRTPVLVPTLYALKPLTRL